MTATFRMMGAGVGAGIVCAAYGAVAHQPSLGASSVPALPGPVLAGSSGWAGPAARAGWAGVGVVARVCQHAARQEVVGGAVGALLVAGFGYSAWLLWRRLRNWLADVLPPIRPGEAVAEVQAAADHVAAKAKEVEDNLKAMHAEAAEGFEAASQDFQELGGKLAGATECVERIDRTCCILGQKMDDVYDGVLALYAVFTEGRPKQAGYPALPGPEPLVWRGSPCNAGHGVEDFVTMLDEEERGALACQLLEVH
eukprot:EG_transcript_12304